ncbi:hypothetical protein Taro_053350 [Colocasia esculenta]|uniref:Uncharacterized protein n=1 Tax=Colocasia esculenta TaxID=4460 RepID=A0A843XMC5_COLES|nr:hypothetical protein [Colocasia esculenta]
MAWGGPDQPFWSGIGSARADCDPDRLIPQSMRRTASGVHWNKQLPRRPYSRTLVLRGSYIEKPSEIGRGRRNLGAAGGLGAGGDEGVCAGRVVEDGRYQEVGEEGGEQQGVSDRPRLAVGGGGGRQPELAAGGGGGPGHPLEEECMLSRGGGARPMGGPPVVYTTGGLPLVGPTTGPRGRFCARAVVGPAGFFFLPVVYTTGQWRPLRFSHRWCTYAWPMVYTTGQWGPLEFSHRWCTPPVSGAHLGFFHRWCVLQAGGFNPQQHGRHAPLFPLPAASGAAHCVFPSPPLPAESREAKPLHVVDQLRQGAELVRELFDEETKPPPLRPFPSGSRWRSCPIDPEAGEERHICRLCNSLNVCASSILLSPFLALRTSEAKFNIEGLDIALDGEDTTLHGEGGLTGPRSEDETVRGDKVGLSINDFFTGISFGADATFGRGVDWGVPGSGSRRSLLLVSCQNLAGTLMPRGVARARAGVHDSCAPELLPEETLSVSDEAERSPPSKDARLPSSKIIEC